MQVVLCSCKQCFTQDKERDREGLELNDRKRKQCTRRQRPTNLKNTCPIRGYSTMLECAFVLQNASSALDLSYILIKRTDHKPNIMLI